MTLFKFYGVDVKEQCCFFFLFLAFIDNSFHMCFLFSLSHHDISMGECNTILSAYTKYRHLGWYCTHPSIYPYSSITILDSDEPSPCSSVGSVEDL